MSNFGGQEIIRLDSQEEKKTSRGKYDLSSTCYATQQSGYQRHHALTIWPELLS